MIRHLYIKRIGFFLAFLLLVFAGDRLGGAVIQKLLLRSNFRFSKLYSGNCRAEIVFMGDSRGVNSFYSPDISAATGKSTMNLSYNGLSLKTCFFLLQDYLERNPKPKKLFLEISSVFKTEDEEQDLFSSVSLLRPYWPSSQELSKNAWKSDHKTAIATTFSHLFFYNSEMTLRALYYLRRTDQDWINSYNISTALVEQEVKLADSKISFRSVSQTDIATLKEFIDLCQSNQIELSMIIAPKLPEFRQRFLNFDLRKEELSLTLGGQDIWDGSSLLQETSCFADRVHTNHKGASLIIQELIAVGLLEEIHAD